MSVGMPACYRTGTTRTRVHALLAVMLFALTSFAYAGSSNFMYPSTANAYNPGYTGYDAGVDIDDRSVSSSIEAYTFTLSNAGAASLPIGTALRVQYYSNPDPLDIPGNTGPLESLTVSSMDSSLSCTRSSAGQTVDVSTGQTFNAPAGSGAGLVLDMTCSLTKELPKGKIAQVVTNNLYACGNSRPYSRPVWLGRASVTLPAGYMDEFPLNDIKGFTINLLPIC